MLGQGRTNGIWRLPTRLLLVRVWHCTVWRLAKLWGKALRGIACRSLRWRWHLSRHISILCWPCILLGRVRHRCLEKSFIVPSRFDELLVQLLKVIFLLCVLPNEFDQLWPNRKSAVVKLRDLFVISNVQVSTASAKQC